MTALAVRVSHVSQLNWPRVGAWSGSLSLHFLIAVLLLVPAAAIQIVRHSTPAQIVQIITAPIQPAQPLPALPTPVKLVPHVHTPPIATPVATIMTQPSNMPVFVPTVAATAPNASQAVPAETAPSAIAYGNRTQVAYPRDALRNREQGTVVLRVLVGADGAVLGVEIEKTSGSRSLDRAARAAVATWSFHPATRNGVARSAWALVPVTFNLQQL